MRPRILSVFMIGFVFLLGVGPATAQRQAGTLQPLGTETLPPLLLGRALEGAPMCQLGEHRGPIGYVLYVYPPNDRYFTLLDPAQCTACPAQSGVLLDVAHIGLAFPVACTQHVTVSVVGTKPGGAGCLVPDESHLLCTSASFTLTAPSPGAYNVALPLPSGCCIDQPVFLSFNFYDVSTCYPGYSQVGLVVVGLPCASCETWNFYPNSGGPGDAHDEMCTAASWPSGAGNIFMYADAECCNLVTPTERGTWGRIKILYR